MQIAFTGYKKVEMVDIPLTEVHENEVMVKTYYSAISAGTERANLLGDVSMPGMRDKKPEKLFPRYLGYSESGVVEKVGAKVTSVQKGDHVMCFWGRHGSYQILPEGQVIPIPNHIDLLDAAFIFIGTFPLAAIRKVKVEIGESAMVVGLGLLGQMSIQLLRIAGAAPIIAVDSQKARRELALKLGADLALDPTDTYYEERVKSATGGKGVSTMIEVTGKGEALNQGLRCMSKMGRVALLGCTRQPTEVDFYYDVHLPGIEMYGAHTFARPEHESYPGHWTHRDDCLALIKLISMNRLNMHQLISEIHTPQEASEVYWRMLETNDFPVGVAFDWTKI